MAAMTAVGSHLFDSAAHPSPDAIKKAGGVGFIGYISTPGNPKNLTREYCHALRQADLDVVVVFETTATRPLGGAPAGHADAISGRSQLEALGAPPHAGLYFAVDFDPAGASQLQAIREYFAAIRAGLGPHPEGGYGGIETVAALGVHQLCALRWQTGAWSAGKLAKDAQLYQRINQVTVGGVTCDLDVVLSPGYGGWDTKTIATPGGSPTRRNPHTAPTRVISYPPPRNHPGDTRTIGGHFMQVGDDVRWVQWAVHGLEFDGSGIDGEAGPATDKGIRAFQHGHHDMHGRPLAVDGVVGDLTRWALEQVKH